AWLYRQDLRIGSLRSIAGGSLAQRRDTWGISGPACDTTESPRVVAFANRAAGCLAGREHEWAMLSAGTDAVTAWPTCRWDESQYFHSDDAWTSESGRSYTHHAALCDDSLLVGFDAQLFFGDGKQASAAAASTTPDQRLLLEVGYEVLHLAAFRSPSDSSAWKSSSSAEGGSCMSPLSARLRGRGLGFFVAAYSSRCSLPCCDLVMRDAHLSQGSNNGMTAARLAYVLGTTGPTMRIDTACSSALVALSCADQDLRRRNRETRDFHANVASSSMAQVDPLAWVELCRLGMLSRRGRCFTFDNSSDGFTKGEGCSAVLLMLPSHLETSPVESDFVWAGLKDGLSNVSSAGSSDRFACIAASGVNQDGRSASMTAPHGPSQGALTRQCLADGRIQPADVSVAECHGTGTALGDPIEVGALRTVLGGGEPVLLSTVKSNMGHSEANAGLSGVIKVVSLLSRGAAPAGLHVRTLNQHMDFDGFPWFVVAEFVAPAQRTDGFAGVQGFGLGGTNARAEVWGRASLGSKAPRVKRLDFAKLDFVGVPCPGCSQTMCWLCSEAKPDDSELCTLRHRCTVLRQEPGGYSVCSSCLQFGVAPFQDDNIDSVSSCPTEPSESSHPELVYKDNNNNSDAENRRHLFPNNNNDNNNYNNSRQTHPAFSVAGRLLLDGAFSKNTDNNNHTTTTTQKSP
ncbi:unnamed protein product, partial [Polarella glacialis]